MVNPELVAKPMEGIEAWDSTMGTVVGNSPGNSRE
jgi:hypothetical protein